GRARGAAAGAVLGDVARPRRRPADDRARLEAVARTVRSRPGAALGDVAVPRRGPALDSARLEPVGRARAARPGAALRRITIAGGRATDRARIPRRMLAGVARAVALIQRAGVPVRGARRARRALRVRGAVRARARAVLRRVAVARRGPARGEGREEAVGRTGRARPRAGLVRVARPGRGAAHRPRVPRRMLAAVAAAVALVEAARIPVARAGRAGRLLGVGGARRARAGARVGLVALARDRAAHRPGVAGRMLAGVVRPVALIRAARVAVVGTGGPG